LAEMPPLIPNEFITCIREREGGGGREREGGREVGRENARQRGREGECNAERQAGMKTGGELERQKQLAEQQVRERARTPLACVENLPGLTKLPTPRVTHGPRSVLTLHAWRLALSHTLVSTVTPSFSSIALTELPLSISLTHSLPLGRRRVWWRDTARRPVSKACPVSPNCRHWESCSGPD